jgi:hypothetical protein
MPATSLPALFFKVAVCLRLLKRFPVKRYKTTLNTKCRVYSLLGKRSSYDIGRGH